MTPHATRFLIQLAASVFAAVAIDGFDVSTMVGAIAHGEHAVTDITDAAGLTPAQGERAMRALEGAGYVEPVGMLVRLTPAGARWYASQRHERTSR